MSFDFPFEAFLKKWLVESDFKAPNLPLSSRLKASGCHYNVNRGKINDLMINFFPNIERFLFPHAQNSLFIFSILFYQISF
jgi:hypothetical protein